MFRHQGLHVERSKPRQRVVDRDLNAKGMRVSVCSNFKRGQGITPLGESSCGRRLRHGTLVLALAFGAHAPVDILTTFSRDVFIVLGCALLPGWC